MTRRPKTSPIDHQLRILGYPIAFLAGMAIMFLVLFQFPKMIPAPEPPSGDFMKTESNAADEAADQALARIARNAADEQHKHCQSLDQDLRDANSSKLVMAKDIAAQQKRYAHLERSYQACLTGLDKTQCALVNERGGKMACVGGDQ